MRRFELHRDIDETGVSGTGIVAMGVQFPDGKCVMQWQASGMSLVVHDNIESVIAIHGHGGKTRLVWVDAKTEEARHVN